MKKTILLITIIIFSCQEKKENILDNNIKSKKMNNTIIESILKKQISSGAAEEYGSYDDYTEEDLKALILIEDSILKSNGFKIPEKEIFYKKIQKIFNRTINFNSDTGFLKIDFLESCNKELIFKPFTADYQNIYISKTKLFVTDFLAIPEIYDYLKYYPSLSNLEKESFLIDTQEGKEEISRWKDIKDLVQIREKNIQKLINRNKYLFNDNKASLVWLKFHDEYFLESLVKVFGYVEDKDLLKWVLDRNLNEDEFDKILFTKTCDNKYVFHKEVFEVMSNADEKNKKKYLMFLSDHQPNITESNFTNETRINALYCYYATKLSENLDSYLYFSFFPRLKDNKSEEEFRKNNYYNLPDFKELYNYTKNGGVGPAE